MIRGIGWVELEGGPLRGEEDRTKWVQGREDVGRHLTSGIGSSRRQRLLPDDHTREVLGEAAAGAPIQAGRGRDPDREEAIDRNAVRAQSLSQVFVF